ncbi:MAG: ExeA family protein [Planctomycetaceae bacterium]
MYQPFFGLTRRPFSATPDLNFFFRTESIQTAEMTLKNCLESGQGVATLTAPAGMGKTAFCQRLAADFSEHFCVVFLSHANFSTRRSLLQAFLFELGRQYAAMGEQELRLELTTCLRGLAQEGRPVILIVDEAHLLSSRLLEELRTITNDVAGGEPIVRLLLCGQLSLDEKLAHPELEALSQRISTQIFLESFTRQESHAYIAHRIEIAGNDLDYVFTAEALEMIIQASDGMPRCINQLCDHSLLLSYVVENKPVDAEVVREALDDLKQLPLHWNEPIPALSPLEQLRKQAGILNSEESVSMNNRSQIDEPFEETSATERHESAGNARTEFDEMSDDDLMGDSAENINGRNEMTDLSFEHGEASTDESAAYEIGAENESTAQHLDYASQNLATEIRIDDSPAAKKIACKSSTNWEEELVVDHYSQLDARLEQSGRTSFFSRSAQTVRAQTLIQTNGSAVESKVTGDSIVTGEAFEEQIEDISVMNQPLSEGVLAESAGIDSLTVYSTTNFSTAIDQHIDNAMPLLNQLIADDYPVELSGCWDTCSIRTNQSAETILYDTEDFPLEREHIDDLDLNVQTPLTGSRNERGVAKSQEEEIVQLMMEMIEETRLGTLRDTFDEESSHIVKSKSKTNTPAPHFETPENWFGSNDLFSDMQENDPFDDESSFKPSKKFDVIQPDDGEPAEMTQKQSLFPPSFSVHNAGKSAPHENAANDRHEREEGAISPRSFVRLFSELRRRQQRSA